MGFAWCEEKVAYYYCTCGECPTQPWPRLRALRVHPAALGLEDPLRQQTLRVGAVLQRHLLDCLGGLQPREGVHCELRRLLRLRGSLDMARASVMQRAAVGIVK